MLHPDFKSPLAPLYERGEIVEFTSKTPPFVKGDLGGFLI
jgi:hypothetical protein